MKIKNSEVLSAFVFVTIAIVVGEKYNSIFVGFVTFFALYGLMTFAFGGAEVITEEYDEARNDSI